MDVEGPAGAVQRSAKFSRFAAAAAMAVGIAVLLGWLLDATALKGPLPGQATMKADTAVAFILSGIALWLLTSSPTRSSARARIGLAAAVVVALVGVLTLTEYLVGSNIGIDELLFRDATSAAAGTPHPGRMSPNTALSLVLVGTALLSLDVQWRHGVRPAEWLALLAALISYLALLGFIYGVESLRGIGPYATMALHTVLTFLVLCAGILFARADRGLIGAVTSPSAGGVMGRRLLPAALLVPPFLGWLRTLGQEAGWYDTEFGRALLVSGVVVVFIALIWRNVARLNRVDAERARASQEALRGQELVRAIVDNSPAVIYVKDIDGRYLLINRRYTEIFQLTNDDVLGKTDHDLFSREAADAFRAMDQRVAAADHPLIEEEIAPHVDGPHTYISVKCPLRDRTGTPYGVFGISTDITDRKRIEVERTELLRSAQAARQEAEALNDVARALASRLELQEVVQVSTDAARRLTGAAFGAFFYNVLNEKGESYLLYTLSGAPREAFEKFGLPRNTPLFEATFRGTAPVRLGDVRKDPRYGQNPPHSGMPEGHLSVCSYLAVPVVSRTGDVLGGLFFGHPELDVFTERAERVAVGVAAQAAIAIDNARLYQDAREGQVKLQGQVNRLALLDHITRAIGERQDLASIFQVVIRTLEERFPLDFGCICLYDAADESLTVSRVGARSEALALELALSEQARIGIDQNGLLRCVRGQLVHEPDIDDSQFPFPQRLARGGLRALVCAPLIVESKVFGLLVAARREARSFTSRDCEFLRQLSEHVALAAHQAQLHGALQQAYDDLRQTQQAVLQQERLRALGQMASGIAHDINNAISPAALYAESLLERETGLSPKARDSLATIQRAIEDVAQTVLRLREFYRPREPQVALARVDLNTIVAQVIELTRARWSAMPQEKGTVIGLDMELAADLPGIMGAESEIRDSLTNLIFNAVDAMPDGGTLTLRTRAEAATVCTEVCDTGVGMDEDTRRRCLEPFFTTKGERGTGLGLAMVYGMIQRHSGEFEIESAPGQGTTVRLAFARAGVDIMATTRLSAPHTAAKVLRILLVDDDPLLIRSMTDILEADGHRVTQADGGQAGIDAFVDAVARDEPYDLLITDLGMPYVDGRKVAAAVRQIARATPIILLTGWGQRLLDEEDIPPHVDRVLAKPPKLAELRAALAELSADGG